MLVSQPTRWMGWYVGWSVDPDRYPGMLVSQSTLMDRLVCWPSVNQDREAVVCWLVSQPVLIVRYVCRSVDLDR